MQNTVHCTVWEQGDRRKGWKVGRRGGGRKEKVQEERERKGCREGAGQEGWHLREFDLISSSEDLTDHWIRIL